jgi:nuclear pore complex protein Nup54
LSVYGLVFSQAENFNCAKQALQQQTEAVAKLGNVLKRDTRDVEIVLSEDVDMVEDGASRRPLNM